jgi:hypothetical protein
MCIFFFRNILYPMRRDEVESSSIGPRILFGAIGAINQALDSAFQPRLIATDIPAI